MNASLFENPRWYRATTLRERLDLSSGDSEGQEDFDSTLAERKLQQWRTQYPFTDEAIFSQRLEAQSIDRTKFARVLAMTPEKIKKEFPTPPRWLTDLMAAFSLPQLSSIQPLPESLRENQFASLLQIIQPITAHALTRLRSSTQELVSCNSDLPFDPSTAGDMQYESLAYNLLAIFSPIAALEINIARLEGRLAGDTPEQRYKSFVEQASTPPNAVRLLVEYPVVARLLIELANRWVETSFEFLQRLCQDWQLIQSELCEGQNPGVLAKIDSGAGDRHNHGRSVIIATFASGFRTVYKPRSLSVDVHFQELLLWLNERGIQPEFKALKILDRGSYAWTEFIEARECESEEEVSRFYERQGSYLAILYILGATDFHCENLIAASEHPMLLDLEALFHPQIEKMDRTHASDLANLAIRHSVLPIGLLPQRIWSNRQSTGIDMSGIGAQPGQKLPHAVPQWDDLGTDEMRLVRENVTQGGAQNRPCIKNREVHAEDYTEGILTAFCNAYDLLLQFRSELLAEGGPIDAFARDEVRVILRNTRTYGVLLRESCHPDVLQNATERDRLFDRLWSNVQYLPHLGRVIALEQADLWNLDVPRFTSQPGGTDIWAASGERVKNVYSEPSLAVTRRRLQELNEQDRERQKWIIRASLATLSSMLDFARPTAGPLIRSGVIADREALLQGALKIGKRLDELGLCGDDDVSWLGLVGVDDRYCSLQPLGSDLYDGLPGVLLFLAFLGRVTGQERYTYLAKAAVKGLRRQIEENRKFLKSIGGFSGWGGLVYTLGQLGALWDEGIFFQESENLIEHLLPLIPEDKELDVMGGAAGCIGALLSYRKLTSSDRALKAATDCGKTLLLRSSRMQPGVGWKSSLAGEKALAGFSHGAAGYAWALLQLAAVTEEQDFRAAAMDALEYERSLFNNEFRNWPDLRELKTPGSTSDNGSPRFIVAWCHGAPGIGLARLASLPYLDDERTRAEIYAAVQTTLAEGFGLNHSLCHGNLGNVELLLKVSEFLPEPKWNEHLRETTNLIVESINANGWISGVPSSVESPGLMTGLAGMGYQLLRLADPKRVPSVLLLEPIKGTQSAMN